MFLEGDGVTKSPLTEKERTKLDDHILNMNKRALRTLCLAHKDYKNWKDLPANWENEPPDNSDLVLDCIVGIEDPIRKDVRQAVATAKRAGIIVRMVTGDNIETARAIARQCGILSDDGIAMLGSDFRKMKPSGSIIYLY
jgi:magnesium-transporting ATPase (P-type)